MRRLIGAIVVSLMTAFASAQAVGALADLAIDRTFADSKDQRLGTDERPPLSVIQLAKRATSSTKTTVKTKKDGTTVTRETTKTNDGEGNKTKTKTKTTSTSQSGSTGASYEGE